MNSDESDRNLAWECFKEESGDFVVLYTCTQHELMVIGMSWVCKQTRTEIPKISHFEENRI